MENVKSEYLNKVITIKIRNNTRFQGILVGVGTNWLLLKYIPRDFVIDGYALINTNYVLKIDISENDIFKEEIFKLREVSFESINEFDLDNTDKLMHEIKSKLISFEIKDHEKNYVGNVSIIREKSMRVHLISNRCEWLKIETFLYKEIRAIYFEDDYLYSLGLLVKIGDIP